MCVVLTEWYGITVRVKEKYFKTQQACMDITVLRCTLLWFTSLLLTARVKTGMGTLPQSEEPLKLSLSFLR
jgi:hypothetical protein